MEGEIPRRIMLKDQVRLCAAYVRLSDVTRFTLLALGIEETNASVV